MHDSDVGSVDEVPLTQIKVKTSVDMSESRRNHRDEEEDLGRKYGVGSGW